MGSFAFRGVRHDERVLLKSLQRSAKPCYGLRLTSQKRRVLSPRLLRALAFFSKEG